MNEQVAQELLRWLQGARETIETQAPVLAYEIIHYAILSDSAGLVISFILLMGAGVLFWLCMQADTDEGFGYGLFGGIVFFIGGLIGFVAVMDLLWALTAPHWYVLHSVLPGKS